MLYYCIQEFKEAIDKLKKNNSYRDIEREVSRFLFIENASSDDFRTGTNLNLSLETPFIKKRLKGRGGYRIYFLLIIKDDKLFLVFIHPKTGSFGSENIKHSFKAEIYKKVVDCIENGNYYSVTRNDHTGGLNFGPSDL